MICLALFGATLMLLAAAPGLIVLALLMVCLGVPLSPWLGSLSASVQRAVPAASSTEAFAWSFAVITVGMAAGNAISGVVIQTANTAVAFASAGGLSLAGALFGTCRLVGRRSHQPARRSGCKVGPREAGEPPGVADTKPMNCSDGQSSRDRSGRRRMPG